MPEKERHGLPLRCAECSPRCHSRRHCDLVTSAITKSADQRLISYLSWICHNSMSGVDSMGRTPLHIAASCGKRQLVEWLVKVHGVALNVEDKESGMTALQRAVFYGQLAVVRSLIMLGACAVARDHADMTSFDAVHADRLPLIDLTVSAPCEPYVWGDNTWFSIGVERIKSQPFPQLMDVFRRASLWIKQIEMSKFHTVFLCQSGEIFTCGHGVNGRLGHGDEESVLAPKQLKAVKGENCIQVAVSVDHTVLLMESGSIWTFGVNDYYQLGHSPAPTKLLAPRLVDWSRNRADNRITGVCAARYHSVFWNGDFLYCVGLNGGQLGQHKDETTDKRLLLPRKVTMLDVGTTRLTHVVCCDGATVAATAAGEIYLLTEYRCRKIASRLLNLRTVCADGGQLDLSAMNTIVRPSKPACTLRVAALSAVGNLYIWQQDYPSLIRCVATVRREVCFSDLALHRHGVFVCSENGQAFTGSVALPRDRLNKPLKAERRTSSGTCPVSTYARLHMTRVPHVHRAVRVTCDRNGTNYAALQCDPRTFLLEVPQVSTSDFSADFAVLLDECCVTDSVHDILLKTDDGLVPGHLFLLAAGSSFFSRLLGSGDHRREAPVRLQSVSSAVLRQIMRFLYTGHCDVTRAGTTSFRLETCSTVDAISLKPSRNGKQRRPASSSVNPVQVIRQTAKTLGVHALYRQLEGVRLVGGRIEMPHGDDPTVEVRPPLDPSSYASLCDVTLVSSDGLELPCHKCVLCARLEYFRLMLATCCWMESGDVDSSTSARVSLPIPGDVLAALLQFCYTDSLLLNVSSGSGQPLSSPRPPDQQLLADDVEFLCSLLATADQMLATRLKQLCEVAISRHISLKNAVELLELAALYNAQQLKTTCMQFVCINLAAIMENRTLEVASDAVMDDLSRYYRSTTPALRGRRLAASSDPPTVDHIQAVHDAYPVIWDEVRHLTGEDGGRVRSRPSVQRRRTNSRREVTTPTQSRPRTLSEGSSVVSVDEEDMDALEDQLQELDLSDLVERQISAAADVEFTVVKRRRAVHRCSSEEDAFSAPAAQTTPDRYIPGMTPRPTPSRTRLLHNQPTARCHGDGSTAAVGCHRDGPRVEASCHGDGSSVEVGYGDGSTAAAGCHGDQSPVEPCAFPSLSEAFPSLNGQSPASRPDQLTDTKLQSQCGTSVLDSGGRALKRTSRRGRPLDLGSCGSPHTPPCDTKSTTSVSASPPVQPPRVAWGQQTATEYVGESSLASIMLEEQHQRNASPSESDTDRCRPAPTTAVVIGDADGSGDVVWGSPPSETVWGSPRGPALSPGKSVNGSSQTAVASLTDIMSQERQRLANRQQRSNKSLQLIQIEERAIGELLEYYDAPRRFDVRISVEPVVPDSADPQWKYTRK